jgi:dihydroxyacetone kinase-like predicted kinase
MDGVQIKQGHYIGIKDKTIVVSDPGLLEASQGLLSELMTTGGEILTVLTGEGADAEQSEALERWLAEQYPDAEVEVHEGGQPLYPYLFAVEP